MVVTRAGCTRVRANRLRVAFAPSPGNGYTPRFHSDPAAARTSFMSCTARRGKNDHARFPTPIGLEFFLARAGRRGANRELFFCSRAKAGNHRLNSWRRFFHHSPTASDRRSHPHLARLWSRAAVVVHRTAHHIASSPDNGTSVFPSASSSRRPRTARTCERLHQNS